MAIFGRDLSKRYSFKRKVLLIVLGLATISLLIYGSILNSKTNDTPSGPNKWTVILAIPTKEEKLHQRSIIRMLTKQFPEVYCKGCNPPHNKPRVKILFFIGRQSATGNFKNEMLLQQENRVHDDLVLMNITENMNDGKTWEVIHWIFENRENDIAEFVLKSDDDSFVNIPGLLKRLDYFKTKHSPELMPRLYYGFPWSEKFHPFTPKGAIMVGMGYTLGWDLIGLFAINPQLSRKGAEDVKLNGWLKHSAFQPILRIGDRVRFHDPPYATGPVSWSYRCDDVIIHKLKKDEDWSKISAFFFNCCQPFIETDPQKLEKLKQICTSRALVSTTCCSDDRCDRSCATDLRQIEPGDPEDIYVSDEDLAYLEKQETN